KKQDIQVQAAVAVPFVPASFAAVGSLNFQQGLQQLLRVQSRLYGHTGIEKGTAFKAPGRGFVNFGNSGDFSNVFVNTENSFLKQVKAFSQVASKGYIYGARWVQRKFKKILIGLNSGIFTAN